MRKDVLPATLVFVVQIPVTFAYVTGLLPLHPIVIMLPLVGFLNGHVEGRGPQGLGLTIVGLSFERGGLCHEEVT